MIHALFQGLDKALTFNHADAHCDIPCKIYDPATAQIAALSIIRLMDLIAELGAKEPLTLADQAQLARLVAEKEIHAARVKDEIRVIWGDYFKQPQFEQFPETHTLVHNIMLTGSACKQHIGRENGEKLLALVNEFSTAFWTTKGVSTYIAECPYPPAMQVVYPKLG